MSGGTQGRVGSVVNGKWQVDARIGSGGMATVYAATHRNGHRAALKMLHTQLSRDPSTRARFLREGYVANAVAHPGVVGVLDDGVTEDGSVYLVLELLEGETVDDRRNRFGGSLPVEEALDIADDALDALAAAHEKGIVHRDVKPENVFRTHEGKIKLLDFGLARMKNSQSEVTKTGVTIGTPQFMPPEQALGRRDDVDARSDVWGLGATLFTMITGRYVHDDATSLHEQLMASATRRSRPIRQLAPHVSPSIAAVVDRALELEMADRWPSARDMQAALRGARGGRAGFAAQDSTTLETAAGARAHARSPRLAGYEPTGRPTTERLEHPTSRRPAAGRESPDLDARRVLLRPIQTPSDGRRTLMTPSADNRIPTGSAVTVTAAPDDRRVTVSDSGVTDVRVDGPTVAAAWLPAPPSRQHPSPNAFPISQTEFDPDAGRPPPSYDDYARAQAQAYAQGSGSPRAFQVPSNPSDEYAVPTGPAMRAQRHSAYPPMAPYPNSASGPLPMVPAPALRGSSVRVIVLVAIGLLVVCASMAAYVLWRGPSPFPP